MLRREDSHGGNRAGWVMAPIGKVSPNMDLTQDQMRHACFNALGFPYDVMMKAGGMGPVYERFLRRFTTEVDRLRAEVRTDGGQGDG